MTLDLAMIFGCDIKAQTAKAKPDKQDSIKLEKLTPLNPALSSRVQVPNSPSCLWFSFPVSSPVVSVTDLGSGSLALGKFLNHT